MDSYYTRRTMEDEIISDVTVTDVYDQAAGIGKEFEKLIETYGVESVTDLMPKVIRALEQLEALASKYEQESNEISDLKLAVDKLQTEKADKVLERARFEEELIQIEETWQSESRDQLTAIARLQEDNRRLHVSLSEQKTAVKEEVAEHTKKTEEKEIAVLTKLKEQVDKQRDEIRKQTRENKQKNVDIEALQTQSERLVKINIELRHKNSSHRKHARNLLGDKVDLETKLAEKEQQIVNVTELLREQEVHDDKGSGATGSGATGSRATGSDSGAGDKDRLPSITEENDDGYDVDSGITVDTDTMVTDGGVQTELESPEYLSHKLSMVGKAVFDKQDPDRPRFTLNELRTVLMERNDLRARLYEVEQELDMYKNNNSNAQLSEDLTSLDDDIDEDEAPVQGPINREPDEKLFPDKKRPSGIRKFFSSLFGNDPPPRDVRRRQTSTNAVIHSTQYSATHATQHRPDRAMNSTQ